jgi:hypothetical protein
MREGPYIPHKSPTGGVFTDFQLAQNAVAAVFYPHGTYVAYTRGDYFFSPAIPLEYGKEESAAQRMLTWVAEVARVGERRMGQTPEAIKEAASCLLYLLRNGVLKPTAASRGMLTPRRILCEPIPSTCQPVIAALEQLLTTIP